MINILGKMISGVVLTSMVSDRRKYLADHCSDNQTMMLNEEGKVTMLSMVESINKDIEELEDVKKLVTDSTGDTSERELNMKEVLSPSLYDGYVDLYVTLSTEIINNAVASLKHKETNQ